MRQATGGRKARASLCILTLAFAAAAASPVFARARKADVPPPQRLLPATAQGPVTIVVSTDAQRLTVYDGDNLVAQTSVSTGVADHPTPHGVFSVIEKQVEHRSNLYDDAPMPYMQRLTWSGVALHEGRVTGRPASHGCVRLPAAFAKELYGFTKRGARVIIAREDVSPSPVFGLAPFSHPQPRVTPPEVAVEGFVGEIEPPAPASGPSRFAATRDMVGANPVTVLVNRKAGRLYVRRAFKPIFEMPVTIDQPHRPLGAHLFVAQSAGAPGQVSWTATSVPGRMREAMLDTPPGRGVARDLAPAPLAFEPSAREALARIHLPPGPAALLAGLVGKGAALIISDDGARGKESWAGTNFIALVE